MNQRQCVGCWTLLNFTNMILPVRKFFYLYPLAFGCGSAIAWILAVRQARALHSGCVHFCPCGGSFLLFVFSPFCFIVKFGLPRLSCGHVRLRKYLVFNVCQECADFREMKRMYCMLDYIGLTDIVHVGKLLKTEAEMQNLLTRAIRHNDFVVFERSKLTERQQLGRSFPESHLHISLDGSAGIMICSIWMSCS